jgi:hypothetical protein
MQSALVQLRYSSSTGGPELLDIKEYEQSEYDNCGIIKIVQNLWGTVAEFFLYCGPGVLQMQIINNLSIGIQSTKFYLQQAF